MGCQATAAIVGVLVLASLAACATDDYDKCAATDCGTNDQSRLVTDGNKKASFESWKREEAGGGYTEADANNFFSEDTAVSVRSDGCGHVVFASGRRIERFNSTGHHVWSKKLSGDSSGKRNHRTLVAMAHPDEPGRQVIGVVAPVLFQRWTFKGFTSAGAEVFSVKLGGSDTFEGVAHAWDWSESPVALLATGSGDFVVVVGRHSLSSATTRVITFDRMGVVKSVKAHRHLPRRPTAAAFDNDENLVVAGGRTVVMTNRASLKVFSYSAASLGARFHSLSFDSGNNCFASGQVWGRRGRRMIVVKLSPAGTELWSSIAAKDGTSADAVHVDNEDNVIVSGYEQDATAGGRKRMVVRLIDEATGRDKCKLMDASGDTRDTAVSDVTTDNEGRIFIAGKQRSPAGIVNEFVARVNATADAGCAPKRSMRSLPRVGPGCSNCNQTCTGCAGGPNVCTRCKPGFRLDGRRRVCRPRPWRCAQLAVSVRSNGKAVVRWARSGKDVDVDASLQQFSGESKWILEWSTSIDMSGSIGRNVTGRARAREQQETDFLAPGRRYYFRVRSTVRSMTANDTAVNEEIGGSYCKTSVVITPPRNYTGCARGQKKCFDGQCYDAGQDCPAEAATPPTCPEGQTLCEDTGECAATCQEEYDGCAVTKVLCADGRCVGNQKACSKGCTGDGEERCYDDSCAPFGTCPDDPAATKVEATTVRVSDTSEGVTPEVEVTDSTGNSVAMVSVESEDTFAGVTGNVNMAISPVADSVVQKASNRNSDSVADMVTHESPLLDATFTEESTGSPVTIRSSVSLLFNCTMTGPGRAVSELALAYIDESDKANPTWKIEDGALTKDPATGMCKGKTSHFTKFGVVVASTVPGTGGSEGGGSAGGLGGGVIAAIVVSAVCCLGLLCCCESAKAAALAAGAVCCCGYISRRRKSTVRHANDGVFEMCDVTREPAPFGNAFSPKGDRPSTRNYNPLATRNSSNSLVSVHSDGGGSTTGDGASAGDGDGPC